MIPMDFLTLPADLRGYRVHMIGIKGTGMTALAELLVGRGAIVTGSDVSDRFYTDEILRGLGIDYRESFDPEKLPEAPDLVVHSAAYNVAGNAELAEAVRRGFPVASYPEALGAFSRLYDSSGIAGVHGKTTTTALTGTLLAAAGVNATVLVGSAVSNFGGRCTLSRGDRFFVAETCEYRRHFMYFSPNRIVLTSVESDHQDFFPEYSDILEAFVQYTLKLPASGELIYCADDRGASEAASLAGAQRPDIVLVPYGRTASGAYRLASVTYGEARSRFVLEGFDAEFSLRVPGEHIVLDAAGAIALAISLIRRERGSVGAADIGAIGKGLESFTGSKRRSEILGEAGGILFMDDYGHHPTAIRKTLEGLRAFYPGRRIIADFMSHTYSRTAALLEEFASCFGAADEVILHRVYPSAREAYTGGVTGRTLFERLRGKRPASYFEEPMDAFGYCLERLVPGDLFVTMGAGDNWKLGAELFRRLSSGGEKR